MISDIIKDGVREDIPEMKTRHLHVYESLDVDDLTPPFGKRICIFGFSDYDISISVQTNSTAAATLSFGTGNGSDVNKILAEARKDDTGGATAGGMTGIKVIGEVDEIVRLTNMTFSSGTGIVRITVFYKFI